MSFQVSYAPKAQEELREATAWYERRASGLGVRFAAEVGTVLRTIAADPYRYPKAGLIARKARVLGWPYSVFFAVSEKDQWVTVVALWHGKRSPRRLRQRIS